MIATEKAVESFPCLLCDFRSNWGNGLTIHMARKHCEIEQLDGNMVDSEDIENKDQKYFRTRHYWEKGKISTVYQTFIDAQEIIDKSDLNEDEKGKEKFKLMEARKNAFGQHYRNYPPWSLMSRA